MQYLPALCALYVICLDGVLPFFSEDPSERWLVVVQQQLVVAEVAPGAPGADIELNAVGRVAGVVSRRVIAPVRKAPFLSKAG